MTTYVITDHDRAIAPDVGCNIGEVHHINQDGSHDCPTGLLWCYPHAAVCGHHDSPEWDCEADQ